MKRIAEAAAVLLTIFLLGIFWINSRTPETDVTKEQTLVGVILNGTIDDKSWCQSHYEGLEATAVDLNLKIDYRQQVPETEECRQVLEELLQEGCEIIICTSEGYAPWEQQLAEENPAVAFFQATGTESTDNLCVYSGRMYQMRYLSGIVAGLQTKSGVIGFVAAEPIPETYRAINAFTLGVRSVNPQAVVHVIWSGSWDQEESNRSAAIRLIDACPDMDVLTLHTNACSPLEEADARGIWTIGYHMDNSEDYPSTYLTATVWRWQAYYEPHLLACLQGKFSGGSDWDDLDSGVVDLAPLTENATPQAAAAVEAAREKLSAGMFDVFYGPIWDNEGNLQVGSEESMTDATMLQDFDWYVEGVVVHED
jgi:basic membrane protein A